MVGEGNELNILGRTEQKHDFPGGAMINYSCIGQPKKGGSLSVAWWNTSLNPYGGDGCCNIDCVLQTIRKLSNENDLIGLGEIDDFFLVRRIASFCPRKMKVMPLIYNIGRISFKTAIIYNSLRMKVDCNFGEEDRNIVKTDSAEVSGQYRVCQRVRFNVNALHAVLDIFIVHWNQKDAPYGDERKRAAAGKLNRLAFGDDQRRLKDAVAIVMGDFNVEPWSPALRALNVSRSSDFVKKHGGFFNPFWRQMHDEEGSLNCKNVDDIKSTRALFDFLLISSPFLSLDKFDCTERIYGTTIYNPGKSEHSPVGITISWQKGA